MPGQVDDYPGSNEQIIAPSGDAAAITPADDTLLARIPKAVHNAGSAGTIVCKFGSAASTAVTLYMAQGDILYIRPKIVMEASTAGALVALY